MSRLTDPDAATAAGQGEHRDLVVHAHEVCKTLGTSLVLDHVSIDVARQQVVCVIGPSGAGKTTFLRCINHLERIDSGRIEVAGHLIGYHERPDGTLVEDSERNIARQRAEIGFVFQRFNLWPHRTALQNVGDALVHVRGLRREQADAESRVLLERVGLASKCHAYPGKLSGGQQQRVAIARALAMKPELMLFDEATSALDPEMIGEVLDVMRELARDGMTMVCVTHEMGFAREVADRVVVMDEGQVIEDAPPAQLFGNPQHERSRRFLSKIL